MGETMKVVFAGGGTGGHLMPAVATLEVLQEAYDTRALFVTTGRDIEATCLRGLGVDVCSIPADGWNRSIAGKVSFLARMPLAASRSRRILRQFGPDVVVGLGGYASIAPVLMARLMRIPTMLFESNALPGRVTRMLSPVADCVQVQFASTVERLVRRKTIVTGNPIRKRIFLGDVHRAFDRFGLDPGKRTLLVLGGSQGAVPLNRRVAQAVPRLAASRTPLQVLHIAGAGDVEATRGAYECTGLQHCVLGYLEEMEDAYAIADLAIARAGGSSIAELAAMGIPAILVPYPFASDHHQHFNAIEMVRAGAAWLIEQPRLAPDVLAHGVAAILGDAEVLAGMKRAALRVGNRRAAAVVAFHLARLAGKETRGNVSLLESSYPDQLAA